MDTRCWHEEDLVPHPVMMIGGFRRAFCSPHRLRRTNILDKVRQVLKTGVAVLAQVAEARCRERVIH